MTSSNALCRLGGIFDFDNRKEELDEVVRELEQPNVWDDAERAQKLGQERARLEKIVLTLNELETGLNDANDLLEMAVEENDEDSAEVVNDDLQQYVKQVEELEFRRMFSGEMDACNAFLDIQSGSGGTEAQDWAEMLLRMYLRWGESHGFKTELMEASAGDVAGIKSATIRFEGDYVFGRLRTETGVHRLVRKSPLIRVAVAIPLLPRCLSHPKLMMISKLISIRLICASMFIAPVALVDSTLIKLSRRYVSPICRPMLWCNVRMIAHNTRTRRQP